MEVLDWRDRQKAGGPDDKSGKRDRYGRLVLRNPSEITGITLHQTAVRFGKKRTQASRYERALGVHAHATVFDDGVGVIAYPLRTYVWHGNGANGTRIGVECEGLFEGDDYDPTGPRCTTALVEGTKMLLSTLVTMAAKEGIKLAEIDTHRQWSGSRRGDPGRELYIRVIKEYAEPILGLRVNAKRCDPRNGGRPVPLSWDPNGEGSY